MTGVVNANAATPSDTWDDLWSPTPKWEYRAVWLTTLKGLDWPTFAATTAEATERQKTELTRMLDTLQSAGFNTVFLQTRLRGTVIYPSALEPFDAIFTGKAGRQPLYDPLQFAIDECHRRGMQCHAWIVSLQVKDNRYVDPSLASTRQHLCDMVAEVVSRYDVDGIHLDYIRYPEHTHGRGDQRRSAVTTTVRQVYATVKELKPWVCVSTAPLGKYRDTNRYPSYGWNAYYTVFQEAQEWLREGCIDALFPMLYYRDKHYYPFAVDWAEHTYGRNVGMGLGIYQLDRAEGSDWELEAVRSQLEYARHIDVFHDAGCDGTAAFRAGFVCRNTKGVLDEYRHHYRYPALVPAMPWMSSDRPAKPRLHGEVEGDSIRLQWTSSGTDADGQPLRYNIYWSTSEKLDTANASHLRLTYQTCHTLSLPRPTRRLTTHYAVTAIDRYGNESDPACWTDSIRTIRLKTKPEIKD